MRLASCVAVISVLAAAGGADATIIYKTGFEGPEYALGALNGQDGWHVFGGGVPVVTDDQAAGGSQSAVVRGGISGQSGPFHNDPSALSRISVSADIMLASSSHQGAWQFGMLGSGLAPFFGGIDIGSAGAIVAITQGYPAIAPIGTFTRDDWHNVAVRLDFVSKTYDVRFDHSLIGSGLAFCGDNNPCTAGIVDTYSSVFFDTFGGASNNDAGYIDNVRVASVPEPASWALMIAGFAGLGGRLRARRAARA